MTGPSHYGSHLPSWLKACFSNIHMVGWHVATPVLINDLVGFVIQSLPLLAALTCLTGPVYCATGCFSVATRSSPPLDFASVFLSPLPSLLALLHCAPVLSFFGVVSIRLSPGAFLHVHVASHLLLASIVSPPCALSISCFAPFAFPLANLRSWVPVLVRLSPLALLQLPALFCFAPPLLALFLRSVDFFSLPIPSPAYPPSHSCLTRLSYFSAHLLIFPPSPSALLSADPHTFHFLPSAPSLLALPCLRPMRAVPLRLLAHLGVDTVLFLPL